MRITNRWCVAVSVVFTLGAAQPNAQPTIAIAHGDVIDGHGGTPIPNGVVVVRGDKITAVGPYGAVTSRQGHASSTRPENRYYQALRICTST